MSIFRKIPPSATEIPIHVLNSLMERRIYSEDVLTQFEGDLKSYLGTEYCFLFSSGTAALYVVLQALTKTTQKNEVIVPAYTCPSVAAAVIKSGLKVRLCDLGGLSFDMDLECLKRLVSDKTLCIVCVHLFGIPTPVHKIREIATPLGIPIIEDSAQAFGSSINGRKLGTIGDIGIFSFGRGKPFSLMGGGAAVTNDDFYANQLQKFVDKLGHDRFFVRIRNFAELYIYSSLIKPRTYWIPNSLPFLGLGKTIFSLRFHVTQIDPLKAALGSLLLPRNNEFIRRKMRISQLILRGLKPFAASSTFQFPGGVSKSVLLRLPLFVFSQGLRYKLTRCLSRNGFTGLRMYPFPLNEIDGISSYLELDNAHPRAKFVAEHLLTLPVHPLLTEEDIRSIIKIFASIFEK